MTVNQPQFPHPTDIDDDLAILWALNQERLGKLRIEGIISTFGNANLGRTLMHCCSLGRLGSEPRYSEEVISTRLCWIRPLVWTF